MDLPDILNIEERSPDFGELYLFFIFLVRTLFTRITSYIYSAEYENPLECPTVGWRTHSSVEIAAPDKRVDNPREFCSLSTVHRGNDNPQIYRYGVRSIVKDDDIVPRTEMFVHFDDGEGGPLEDVHSFGIRMDGLLHYQSTTGFIQDGYVVGNPKNTLRIRINGTDYYIPLFHEISA